ncbi:UNVERIFIED_CONTAM: hypothetical protein NCL1_43182 [Trichonephila clavipes]
MYNQYMSFCMFDCFYYCTDNLYLCNFMQCNIIRYMLFTSIVFLLFKLKAFYNCEFLKKRTFFLVRVFYLKRRHKQIFLNVI